MGSTWNTCGPDTAHVTFKEGAGRSPIELAALLAEFQGMYDLPTNPLIRDRGLQGFANAAVDEAAGLRLDWTRPNEDGNNAGYFCLQVKGAWFEAADGETAADFLQLLEAYGPYRVTRLDFQQTSRTNNRLTPWWIHKFETGQFRVIGKKHYEPRGKKDAAGAYPSGATLYHGSRTSDRYARQYDKHLQKNDGPPRRRDEVEVKGESARNLWKQMHAELLLTEQLGTQRGATLHSFSKGTIRALLPIRDTSRWHKRELPRKWTSMAIEPTSWSTLFDDDAIQVKPRERKVSSLMKSYRYANENFGAALSVMAIQRMVASVRAGKDWQTASNEAYIQSMDDAVLAANEDRVKEFCAELPPSERDEVLKHWFGLLRQAATNVEDVRDGDSHPPM